MPRSNTNAEVISEAYGRVWEAMEMCEQAGIPPEEIVAEAVCHYYDKEVPDAPPA